MILGNCAVILWYYNVVDLPWMLETSLLAAQPDLPDDVREQAIERFASVSPSMAGGFAAASSAVAVVVLMLLAAGYFSLVSMATNDGIRFKQWLSLAAWSSFPLLAASIASLVNLAVNDAAHLLPTALNPLTFANLLGLDPAPGGGFLARWLQYTDVTTVWAFALMVVGYSVWTGKSAAVSSAIVLGPFAVIIAVSALFALL